MSIELSRMKKFHIGECALVFLAMFISFVVVARVPLLSHLRLIGGDPLDGMLAMGIELHWTNVLDGTAIGWRTTDYFFPIRDTLGYNEGFFLHGIFLDAVMRFGIDAFAGIVVVDWIFRLIGFVAMWILGRRYFAWPAFISALAAALFVMSNAYYENDSGHSQFLACYLLPILVALQFEIVRGVLSSSDRRILIAGALFSIILGSLLITCFYVSFFFILTDLVVSSLYFALTVFKGDIAKLRQVAWRARMPLGISAMFLIIGVVPCLLIYGPKALETGMHPLSDISPFALNPWDIFNVGPYNVLWGHLLNVTLSHITPAWSGTMEAQSAASPVVFLLFFVGGLMAVKSYWNSRRQVLAASAWLACMVLLFITIKWPYIGWPWLHLYPWIPGASAVRVVSRIQLVLILPILCVACDLLAKAWRQESRKQIILILSLLLVVEQVNDAPVYNMDRPTELALLAAVPPPPAGCKAFYAENSGPGPDIDGIYRHNVDSMMIAERFALPTVNGFATFTPTNWNLLHPDLQTYLPAVRHWIAMNKVGVDVCGLNFKTDVWTDHAE